MLAARCFWCNEPLRPSRRGRPRQFCSDRCRQRWRRWRRETLPPVDPELAALAAWLWDAERGDPDEAVVAAVLRARSLIPMLRGTARRARPPLAARLVRVAQALEEALAEAFPDPGLRAHEAVMWRRAEEARRGSRVA